MSVTPTVLKRPVPWLIVLVVLLAVGEGIGGFLAAQGETSAAAIVRVLGRIGAGLWVLWALHVWKRVRWVARARAAIAAVIVGGLVAAISTAMGWDAMVYIVAGVLGMAATFFVGIAGVRLALSPGTAVTGVARTLVDEAIRMRLPVVFIVGVMVVVPVLPFVLDPADRLEYRLQSFLSWATIMVSLLLSLMTIFLAIGTVTRELERRQVFLSLTKPVRRWQYLGGKWLGIAGLNGVLVATAGVGVYAFTLYVADQPALDARDREAVSQRVLVAREAAAPTPSDPGYFARAFEERLERLRETDPQSVAGVGPGGEGMDRAQRQSIRQALVNEWFSVGPRSTKMFVFAGLGEAARTASEVQLRIEPEASTESQTVRMAMRLNGRAYMPYNTPLIELSTDTPHTLWVPTQAIGDDGVLRLEIANPSLGGVEQPTISFNPTDGLQVLYRVGGFAPNLARSMGLLWVRLCFLAVLGLAASTFLSFPVAALLCTMVYLTASGGQFLTDSLDQYATSPRGELSAWELIRWYPQTFIASLAEGETGKALKLVISMVGQGFAALVPSFAEYSGGDLVANGRLVSFGRIGEAVLKVGLLWGGVAGLIGYALFRRKELAKVTV